MSDWVPAWSPDGSRLTFVRDADGGFRTGEAALYIANRDGTGLRMLQRLGQIAGDYSQQPDAPAWSRDGAQIAYGSGPLWVVSSDGSSRRRLPVASTCSPDWSPDGRTLVYLGDPRPCRGRGGLSAAPGYRAIHRIDADGTNHRLLARGSFGDVAWSPDGALIAYTGSCAVRHELDWTCAIYVMNADGSNKRLLVKKSFGCGCVAWIAGGTELLWNNVGTYATNVATGVRHTVFRGAGSPAGVSSDGTRIAIAGWGQNGRVTIVSSAGDRIARGKTPRGWNYTGVSVYLPS